MAGLKSSMLVFAMLMVASFQMQSTMAQTRHVVGGSLGWTIPPNGAGAYTTWASGQTFRVGDSLFFNFTTGNHNVAEVAQAAYGPCTSSNPISLITTGPATVPLTTAGTHYFVCGVGQHCSIGQKVSVNVVAAASAPATPPAATPTTAPPTATPTPTTTPTPAPVSPPTTTPSPAPGPSTTTPPTATPTPSPATDTASPPSPPTTGPSSGPTTGVAPTGDNTPTPPAPSAAAAISVGVPATFLAVALALFY
ncbi:cupredoxin, Blue (type 1) copper protein, binding site [Artemisia annua]|uniref:Cupredoxin, Blue (Type 1) copper protein, binding site n=1 Tax=Artemisia annua TaxID=35608 RepID=A0A2U1NIN6_ARTAN|nr:cupredoxin, Blue (type 1) copper protein, binding site [Artemisia annua]